MSKKSGKIFIVSIMLIMLVFVVAACGPNQDKVTIKEIAVKEIQDGVEIKDFSISDIKFTVTDSNNNAFVINGAPSMLSSEDLAKLSTSGTHTITFTYQNVSVQATVTLYPNTDEHKNNPEDKTVTVSFNTNGGTVVPSVSGETSVVIESEPITTKDGAVFGGWFADSNFATARIAFPYETKRSMVWYAKWIENQVTVYFDGNAEDVANVPGPQSITAGSTLSSVNKPSRAGYTFEAWYTSPDYKADSKVITSTSFSANATLYAKWKPISYKLTYDMAGGIIPDTYIKYTDVSTKPTRYNADGTENVNGVYIKAGKKFIPYRYDIEYVADDDGYFVKVNENYVVYNPLIHFDFYEKFSQKATANPAGVYAIVPGLNDSDKNVYYDYGTNVSAFGVPYKAGFKFLGWFTEENYNAWDSTPYQFSTMPARSFTLKAKWEVSDASKYFSYTEDIDEKIIITGVNTAYPKAKTASHLSIPNAINGIEVKAIGNDAFAEFTSLIAINIAEGIQSIGEGAFIDSSKLNASLSYIPYSVTSIGKNAFSSNWEYDTVSNDFAVQNIGDGKYVLIKYLGADAIVRIPNGIVKIAQNAFVVEDKNNTLIGNSLQEVIIPASVESIEKNAFANCEKLIKVTFAEGSEIKYIHNSAFNGTPFLNNKEASQSQIIFGDLYYKYFGNESTVVIPANIKYIADYLFSNSTQTIEKFVFEDESNIVTIGKGAFKKEQCEKLSTDSKFCIINNILVRYIGNETKVIIPSNVKTISGYAFGDETTSSNVNNLIIEQNVESILAYAFYGMKNIKFTFMSAVPPTLDIAAFYKPTAYGNSLLTNMQIYLANMNDYYDDAKWAALSEKFVQLKVANVVFDSTPITTAYKLNEIFKYKSNGITVITNDGNSHKEDVRIVFDYASFNSLVAVERLILVDETKYFVKVSGSMVAYDSNNRVHTSLPRYYRAFADYTLYENSYFTIGGIDYTVNENGELVTYSGEGKTKYSGNIFYVKESDGLVVKNGETYAVYDKTNSEQNGLAKYAYSYVKNMNFKVSYPAGTAPMDIIVAYTVSPIITNIKLIDLSDKYFKGDIIDFENAKIEVTYNFGNEEPVVKVIPLIKYALEANATNIQLLTETRYVLIDGAYTKYDANKAEHEGLPKYVRVLDEKFAYSNLSTSVGNVSAVAKFRYEDSTDFDFDYFVDEPAIVSIRIDEKILQPNGTYIDNKLSNVYSISESINKTESYITCVYNNGSIGYVKLNADGIMIENFDTSLPAEGKVMKIRYLTLPEIDFVYNVRAMTSYNAFEFEKSNGQATVTSIKEINRVIYIPESFVDETDGLEYTVIAIAENAFMNVSGIEYIDIPASVKTIGKSAFENSSIETINFRTGSALKEISDYAFYNTLILKNVRFNGAEIASIGRYAFSKSAIENIEIPSSVKTINEWAFYDAPSLTKFNIPVTSQLQYIKASAFEKCKLLSGIYLPETLISLGNNAFAETGINEIIIPAQIKDIPKYLFKDSTSLTSVVLPSATITVHIGAFQGCKNLNAVTFGGYAVAVEGNYVFDIQSGSYIAYNPELHNAYQRYEEYYASDINGDYILIDGEYVVYDAEKHGVSVYATRYSVNYNENANGEGLYVLIDTGYVLYSELPKYKYVYQEDINGELVFVNNDYHPYDEANPDHQGIQRYAIIFVQDAEGAYIFDGEHYVTKDKTFDIEYCENSAGEWVKEGEEYVLYNSAIHDHILDRYNLLKRPCENGDLVLVNGEYVAYEPVLHNAKMRYNTSGSMLETIDDRAFYQCENLIEFTTNGNVKTIGDSTFKNCSKLTAFSFDTGLETIGPRAFMDSGINRITIPSSVKTVGEFAFVNCKNAESVAILSTHIIEIADNMFQGCENLEFAYLLDGISRIGKQSFMDCYNFVGLSGSQNSLTVTSQLPTALTVIDESAFENCAKFNSDYFNIDNNSLLEKIQAKAFKNSGIDYIKIPSTLTVLGDYAFDGCTELKTAVFDFATNLKAIGKYAFRNSSIGAVKLLETEPDVGVLKLTAQLNVIGEGAFSECLNVTSIIIPDNNSLTNIGDKAFYGCYALTDLSIGYSKKGIVNDKLSYTSPLVIGISAFEYCSALTNLFIPGSVSEIKAFAFRNCSSLEYVSFGVAIDKTVWIANPDSATAAAQPYVTAIRTVNADTDKLHPILASIDEGAFYGTINLKKIYTAFVTTLPTLSTTGILKKQNVFTDSLGESHFDNGEFKLIIVDNQGNSDRHITRWGAKQNQIERKVLDYTVSPATYFYTQPE